MIKNSLKKISKTIPLLLTSTFLIAAPISQEPLSPFFDDLSNSIFTSNTYPVHHEFEENDYTIEYTLDNNLMNFISERLETYRPNYSAVVVIDNNNGEILAAIGYEKKGDNVNLQLPFSSSHPAASLAKVISAAALLEDSNLDIEETFKFSGKSTTLKASQLLDRPVRYVVKRHKKRKVRYSRLKTQTFIEAFAHSNNPIFAKAAIEKIDGDLLFEMAEQLGFNTNLMTDIALQPSHFSRPTSKSALAQYASGYNNLNTISPVHAAMIPAMVANDGVAFYPTLVRKVFLTQTKEELTLPRLDPEQILSEYSAMQLRSMMEATIFEGTGRRSFGHLNSRYSDRLSIGAKSGTFTGGVPYGKRDWFITFAIPKNSQEGKGISISVMNVDSKKRIRSSMLVKQIIEYYFDHEEPALRPTPVDIKEELELEDEEQTQKENHKKSSKV